MDAEASAQLSAHADVVSAAAQLRANASVYAPMTAKSSSHEDVDSAAAQLRANASVYALPAALRLDPGSLPLLLRALLQMTTAQVRSRH